MSAAAQVSERDVQRLSKLLGMLGSAHEGERASAAFLATRQLRSIGLTWGELADRAFAPSLKPAQLPQPRRRPPADHRSRITWLMACWDLLSDWERSFTKSLHDQARSLSPRQCAKLDEVVERIERRGGGAAR